MGMTALELSQQLNTSLLLTKQHLAVMEQGSMAAGASAPKQRGSVSAPSTSGPQHPELCRDEAPDGTVRFFPNLFPAFAAAAAVTCT